MVREKIPQEEIPTDKKDEDQLVPSGPGLNHIYKTLGLLDGYTEWKKSLPEKIGPWENSLDLFNNVQKAVMEQVQDKVLQFRDKIPTVSEISDQDIIDTIVNNWPEGIPEISGQRREVLLNVAAHVIKHIETAAYQQIIANATEGELYKLGLTPELREVMNKTLDASMRVDNLFIRFLAFSKLAPESPDESKSHFYASEKDKPHTINELFPRDAQYLSKKYREIAEMPIDWEKIAGGEIFKKYLMALSSSYGELDPDQINAKYKAVGKLYKRSAESKFPILVIPTEYSISGGEKEPHFDPETRIGLRSPECIEMEKELLPKQKIMAELLKKNGYADLYDTLLNKKLNVANSIGDYGVNLKCKATAQMGESVAVIFMAEQLKAHREMRKGKNFQVEGLDAEKSQNMTIDGTLLHELGHLHIDERNKALKRLGEESGPIIQEVEAEHVYRWLIPQLIDSGALKGTREEWAAAMVEYSLTELKDKSEEEDESYYYMASYGLNRLLAEKIIDFDLKTGKVIIKDIDKFYQIQEEQAKEVLNLFYDKKMNKEKADTWIKEKCMPNQIVRKVSKFVKKEK